MLHSSILDADTFAFSDVEAIVYGVECGSVKIHLSVEHVASVEWLWSVGLGELISGERLDAAFRAGDKPFLWVREFSKHAD